MKRCPKCDTVHIDSERFCDLDGTLLIVDSPSLDVEDTLKRDTSRKILAIVTVTIAGFAVGVVLFLVYHSFTRSAQPHKSNQSKSRLASAQQPNPNALLPSPVPTATPSPEQSPLPTPKPSPPTSSTVASLSASAISTGSGKTGHGPVTIRLVDDSTIEADEAWEGRGGLWYRQHGIVTFLERNRMKGIEPHASPSPQSSASPTPRISGTTAEKPV